MINERNISKKPIIETNENSTSSFENEECILKLFNNADNQDKRQDFIDVLCKIGSYKSIDFIIELLKKDGDFLYMYTFDKILEKDKKYSAEKLIEVLSEVYFNEWQMITMVEKIADLIGVEEAKKQFEKNLTNWESNGGFAILAFVLSSAKKEGYKLDYEKIKNLKSNIKESGSDMTLTEKQDVISMAKTNWKQQDPKLAQAVIEGIEKSLQDTTNQKCYILKYNEKVISFIRFEKIDNETEYCGSFNVESELRGLGLGDEMMIVAIKTEAEKKKIEATVSPRLQAGTCYVEKIGFVLDGYNSNYHNTSEPMFNMQLDNKKNKNYAYRNEGKENLINEEQIKKQCWQNENIDHVIGSDSIVLKFDMKKDLENMKLAMEKLLVAKDDNGENVAEHNLENKYVVTRYFQDNKNDKENNLRYFVFEKIK